MTDHVTRAKRRAIMQAVRSKNTGPELIVRRAAHGLGLRFRLHRKDLPGTPDLVFPKRRTVIFVHGCYWHRHKGCSKATMPKTNVEFWRDKFERNVARDEQITKALEAAGWRVAVIWQCQAKTIDKARLHLQKIFSNSNYI
ncbi:very short patch repair endonuclease [Eilatimonas milleporae]|uniref:Very short patch repair endonuclease n=1 Tax=Eilatimonas milleporae TaxID=911205 RepID=A0A3M0CH28_9PROT|nr:very short patch repair endonuclease [Eilatimonas milleporae]RMB08107.1 T/G mismatch-specific endonuclease [Eilatimonas milleporae]